MTLPSPRLLRSAIAAGALLLSVSATAPGAASADSPRARDMRTNQGAAERALDRATALARGRSGADGRELTPELAGLAARLPALAADERDRAEGLLARPTDPDQTNQPGGPYTVPSLAGYTDHFCFHWVTSTPDAPPAGDANNNGAPDYVEKMADAFELVYDRENLDAGQGGLGWREPISDGERGGCTDDAWEGRTDVYVKDIGKLGLYGYAAPDPGQPAGEQSRYAFLVMDDDYAAAEFPGYGGNPDAPMKVTAAHEYNHVLQLAYDVLQDKWMFEATATWMEEKVFPEIDDYHQYVDGWAQRSTMPITQFKGPNGDKVYGSAVFNHWLERGYGAEIVRRAWELSVQEGSFAPGAYDRAIRLGHGPGFSYELNDLAASTAEWQATDSGVHEGAKFPEMKRIPIKLPTDGTVVTGKLDHTGFALFDVEPSNAASIKLSGGLPDGTAGSIALVGRTADNKLHKALGVTPQGGPTSVTLDNPGRFQRVTAVVVNASYAHAGWNGADWNWTRDQQPISLAVSTPGPGPGPGPGPDPDPGSGDDGGGADGGGSPTGPSGGGTTALLRIVTGRLPRLAKAKALTFTAHSTQPGTFTARAAVNARTAKRLGLGRRAVTIGSGKVTLTSGGAAKLKIGLTSKARARLKRQRAAVPVAVRITFTAAGGEPTARTLALKLKR